MTSIFGAVVATPDVEDALEATIAVWVDTYLAEVERQHSIATGTIGRPRSYNATYDVDNWPEGQLPGVAIVCAGASETYDRGSGDVSAWFDASVDVIVTGQTERDARRVAGFYQAALAVLVMQHGTLAGGTTTGFATETEFVGWSLELPDVDNRTLAVGTCELRILVDSIFNASAGPVEATPAQSPEYGGTPEAPFGPWPEVTTTNVTVTAEPINS